MHIIMKWVIAVALTYAVIDVAEKHTLLALPAIGVAVVVWKLVDSFDD